MTGEIEADTLQQAIELVGLAIHSYEFHFERLPSGVIDSNPGPIRNEAVGQHVSWIVQILPFMEESIMSRMFDQSAGAYAPANAKVRGAHVAILHCPSSPEPMSSQEDKVAHSSYAGCYHDQEQPIDKDNHGLLFLNSQVRYADIFDGSSKTILLGDVLTDEDDLGWVSGTRATLRNTSQIEPPPFNPLRDPPPPPAEEKKPESTFVGGFGSHHNGGLVVIGFADGSTRSIPEKINRDLLRRLGNRADGELVEAF